MASWVLTGSSHVRQWPQDFASNSIKAWQKGKEVWICRGLLDSVPESRWGWVEGAEPPVPWKDVYFFFRQLQTYEVRGDFVQIPPTQANIHCFKDSSLQINRWQKAKSLLEVPAPSELF
jgi:hypothetical protein